MLAFLAQFPPNLVTREDIARQLVEEDPGRSVRVILGGGRPSLKTLEQEVLHDPWTCGRRDGADLLGAWRQRHPGGVIVTDRNELEDLDPDAVDFLFGKRLTDV